MTRIEYTSDHCRCGKEGLHGFWYGDGTWTIVKIVMLKKTDGKEFFKFELSKSGKNNVLLYFNVDGTLLRLRRRTRTTPTAATTPTWFRIR